MTEYVRSPFDHSIVGLHDFLIQMLMLLVRYSCGTLIIILMTSREVYSNHLTDWSSTTLTSIWYTGR